MLRSTYTAVLLQIICMLVSPTLFADSPLTSTDFYKAYMDIPQVAMASQLRALNEELCGFLANENTPVDHSAAVINALSFKYPRRNETAVFMSHLLKHYPDARERLVKRDLPGRLLLVLGYLSAMDNYLDETKSIEGKKILEDAEKLMPNSFTAAVIHGLARAQTYVHYRDEWCEVWRTIDETVQRFPAQRRDLRESALKIIQDYIEGYQNDCKESNSTPLRSPPKTSLDTGHIDSMFSQFSFEADLRAYDQPTRHANVGIDYSVHNAPCDSALLTLRADSGITLVGDTSWVIRKDASFTGHLTAEMLVRSTEPSSVSLGYECSGNPISWFRSFVHFNVQGDPILVGQDIPGISTMLVKFTSPDGWTPPGSTDLMDKLRAVPYPLPIVPKHPAPQWIQDSTSRGTRDIQLASDSLMAYFPISNGTSWEYEVTFGPVAPLVRHVVRCVVSDENFSLTSELSPIWSPDWCLVDPLAGTSANQCRLEIAINDTIRDHGPGRLKRALELTLLNDQSGIFRSCERLLWRFTTLDPTSPMPGETYVELVAILKDQLVNAPMTRRREDCYSWRPFFIASSDTWEISSSGGVDRTRNEGIRDGRLHVVRTVDSTGPGFARGFKEELWFEKGKGLIKLVQTRDGQVAMKWELVGFRPGDATRE